jgi:hypothetical protein
VFARWFIAITLEVQDRFQEAEALLRRALALRVRILGPDHPGTLMSMATLANVLQSANRLEEAEGIEREVLLRQEKTSGPEAPETLRARSSLAVTLYNEERTDDAAQMERKTLAVRERVLGPDHWDTGESRFTLAVYLARTAPEESLRLLDLAVSHPLQISYLKQIATEEDLAPLRNDPRFQAILKRADIAIAAVKAHPK